MDKVKLGSQGAVVSRIGLGCMGMSEFYGERDNAESAATMLRSLDLGITFLDTADTYGIGDNEELIGKTIKGRRDEVFLATKFANKRTKENPGVWEISGRPEYVRSACDASMKRLGVEVSKNGKAFTTEYNSDASNFQLILQQYQGNQP